MKNVLVVDDTKNIRSLLTTCLELNGYSVISAKDGIEALDLFKSENIDLAFLDIKLPEVSGTEVLRRIRELGINTPVVIMTAFATVKNAIECTKLGAVAYLQKPFTSDKVKKVLMELDSCSFELSSKQTQYIYTSKKLLKENRNSEAYDMLKKALSLDPDNWQVYSLIGDYFKAEENSKEAEKFYFISESLRNNY